MLNPRTTLFAMLASAVAITFAAVIPTAEGSAAVAVEQQLTSPDYSQSFKVPASAPVASVQRDSYEVVEVPVVGWPSSDHDVTQGLGNFGYRSCAGCSSNHQGDDFNPGYGAQIVSAVTGYVSFAGCGGALGCNVIIEQTLNGVPTGITTVYGHMQYGSISVGYGQQVTAGDLVGLCGSTGMSTGPHLHFEVWSGGVKINPLPWLQQNVNIDAWDYLT